MPFNRSLSAYLTFQLLAGPVLVLNFFLASISFATAQQAGGADAKSNSAATPAAQAPAASSAPEQTPVENMKPLPGDMPKPSMAPAVDKNGTPLYETIQEDWGSLELGVSNLKPEPPLETPVDDSQQNFTRQLVSVKWRAGDPIDLWIVKPKGVKNPPVVLYLYDLHWDTDRFRDNTWAERVTGGGVAAVGFVSALTGHRFHDRPMKQWFVSELQESLGSTVHDVKFILDYLAQRGDLDMTRVGMFGEGSGGTIAILAAASDPRIKVVDALEPWGDWPNFLAKSSIIDSEDQRKEFVKPEFLKKVAPLDPVKWLPQLKVPIRIQLVHQTDATPLECKESIAAAAPKQTEVVRFETISVLAQREGQGRLFGWIKEKVGDAGKTAPVTAGADSPKAQVEQKPERAQP